MSKINLLPWREEIRLVENRVFFALLGVIVFFSALIVLGVHNYLTYKIEIERLNERFINKALETVQVQIKEIQGLQENKKQLLERMDVIKSLEMDRSSTVKLLNLIPQIIPDSIYLAEFERTEKVVKSVVKQKTLADRGRKLAKQIGVVDEEEKNEVVPSKAYKVLIKGIAYSNNGISYLLKKLDQVDWISDVKLDEVQADTAGELEGIGFSFTLSFTQNLIGEE